MVLNFLLKLLTNGYTTNDVNFYLKRKLNFTLITVDLGNLVLLVTLNQQMFQDIIQQNSS